MTFLSKKYKPVTARLDFVTFGFSFKSIILLFFNVAIVKTWILTDVKIIAPDFNLVVSVMF